MIGKSIGHYRITEKIGEGGMGQVFRAHDEHLERDVAIKVLRSGSIPDEHTRKRFRKEAIALSKLNHPNIATIYDFDTQGKIDFIAMEYIPGETLSDKESGAGVAVDKVVEFGVQLAHGLGAAHKQGIIHRDLKPGNIRITPEGRLKILDFGLAKFFQQSDGQASGDSLSVVHGIAGTPSYMSPEQLCGDTVSPASDLFGAGIVLYEMLTGKNPFADVYSQSVSYNVLHTEPSLPSELRADIPPELDTIVMRLLEKRPEDRFDSAAELESALRNMNKGKEEGKTDSTGHPLIRRLGFGLGAAAVIILAILYFNMPVQIYSAESQHRTVRRLTFSGKADVPIWSPAGDNIAYGEDRIKLISPEGSAPRELDSGRFRLAAWSWTPDGKAVLTHGWDPEKKMYLIAKLGLYGEEPQVLQEEAIQPSMSADGKMLVYARRNTPEPEFGVFILAMETGVERKLAEPAGEGTAAYKAFFSPDISKVAYMRWNGLGHELWVINIDGSHDHMVKTDPIQIGGRYCWTDDGDGVLMAGQLNGLWSIWRLNLSGEGHVRMTAGSEKERHVTLAPNGERFVFGRQQDKSRIVILDIEGGTVSRPVNMDVASKHPVISDDNRSVLFQALVNEQWQIWKAPADGSGPAVPVITSEKLSSFGPVRGDGDNILYVRGKVARERRWGKIGWTQTIWCSSCDGGRNREIVEAGDRIERIAPCPYRAGRLLYSTNKSEDFEIVHYLDEDGTPHMLHEDNLHEEVSSFDWGYMDDEILVSRSDTSIQIRQLRVVSALNIQSREITNLFTLDSLEVDGETGIAGWVYAIALSPDRDELALVIGQYEDEEIKALILLYNKEDSSARIISRFNGEELPEYVAWAPDGKRLTLGLYNNKSDIFISEPNEPWSTAMR
jgi:serine/threonine protein kinase